MVHMKFNKFALDVVCEVPSVHYFTLINTSLSVKSYFLIYSHVHFHVQLHLHNTRAKVCRLTPAIVFGICNNLNINKSSHNWPTVLVTFRMLICLHFRRI